MAKKTLYIRDPDLPIWEAVERRYGEKSMSELVTEALREKLGRSTLIPLKQWICDRCGKIIEKPGDGWLEWLDGGPVGRAYGFKIVHHLPASPLGGKREAGCYHYEHNLERSDSHLGDFLGADGLAFLLAFLDLGQVDPEHRGPWVKSMHEFVEIVRRLQVPYYEEARLYWGRAEEAGFFSGANEVWPYVQETLKTLIERYGSGKTPE